MKYTFSILLVTVLAFAGLMTVPHFAYAQFTDDPTYTSDPTTYFTDDPTYSGMPGVFVDDSSGSGGMFVNDPTVYYPGSFTDDPSAYYPGTFTNDPTVYYPGSFTDDPTVYNPGIFTDDPTNPYGTFRDDPTRYGGTFTNDPTGYGSPIYSGSPTYNPDDPYNNYSGGSLTGAYDPGCGFLCGGSPSNVYGYSSRNGYGDCCGSGVNYGGYSNPCCNSYGSSYGPSSSYGYAQMYAPSRNYTPSSSYGYGPLYAAMPLYGNSYAPSYPSGYAAPFGNIPLKYQTFGNMIPQSSYKPRGYAYPPAPVPPYAPVTYGAGSIGYDQLSCSIWFEDSGYVGKRGLGWNADNAMRASISPNIGQVTSYGYIDVVANGTQYILTVWNAAGESRSCRTR
ncbi:hypothetical protein HY968_04125 [Candidatus Kaiserbacteria bacterium]|nr:hypothetical protein [Candidatus Kaiserbacteria bacterium]